MKRRWLVIAAIAALLAATVWWVQRARPASSANRTTSATPIAHRRLDPVKLRAEIASRIERARHIVRHREPATPNTGLTPDGRFLSLTHDFIDPQCWLGPRELCDALADLVTSCDGGDPQDCIAVGQYLADNPPRLLIAISFFIRACRLGEQRGCDRMTELKTPSRAPCEQDIFACSRQAGSDLAREDEACSLGAADSCASAAHLAHDPILSRAYLETGCQLGSPLLCQALAVDLSPTCTPSELHACFPPDEDEAAEARAMACEAGWTYGLDCD